MEFFPELFFGELLFSEIHFLYICHIKTLRYEILL